MFWLIRKRDFKEETQPRKPCQRAQSSVEYFFKKEVMCNDCAKVRLRLNLYIIFRWVPAAVEINLN